MHTLSIKKNATLPVSTTSPLTAVMPFRLFAVLMNGLRQAFNVDEAAILQNHLRSHEKRIAQLCLERQQIKRQLQRLRHHRDDQCDRNIVELPAAFERKDE